MPATDPERKSLVLQFDAPTPIFWCDGDNFVAVLRKPIREQFR